MTDFVQITRVSKIRDVEFFPMVNEMYERVWNHLMPPQLVTEQLSSKVVNNVVTPVDAPIPDCLTCGACCQSLMCVGVRPTDNVDPELYWDVTTETDDGEIVVDRYLKRNGETLACGALSGTIGEKVGCTIYETRPVMCHHFDAGSDRCHAIRRAFGIEPFLSLNEMSEAMEKLDAQPATIEPSEMIRNAEIKLDEETGRYIIRALMRDGTLKQIHDYDPAEEVYFQFEFDGLNIDAANRLIDSRNVPKTAGT
jgi:Fe-S-cluster containining protein